MKILLYLALSLAAPNIAVADPCLDNIPSKLQAALRQRFADERLPVATDSTEDNQVEAKKEGKCRLEASIDLDGDGRKDFVLLMPSVKQPKEYRLVAALPRSNGWHLMTIEKDSSYEFATLAIDRAPPGLYVHTDAFDFVPAPGEVERFRAKHSGFYLGAVEGAADAYFLSNGHWLHVHSID
ncbi:hypothetical protein HDE78_000597 [Rhodanobacter sp. K2T2]|uniref:hypothetical protein n=1 Tax=Rhodanobacter sp. K2T2 TaxID=2723085 RepID=UPI0015CC675E|nr:hypothetical protein [Rhodanobacter sp. K2T2]NYE27672.1 hypothetical protein [Rhodanobacter sp. K2T2]